MNKYTTLQENLLKNGEGQMRVFGNSMIPLIYSGALLTYKTKANYEVGDIVFCKVRGRFVDAHKITKIEGNKGYLISNNHGFDNGWTKTIFGYVTNINY